MSHIFLSFFGVVVLIDDLGVSRDDCVPYKVSPCDVLPSDLGVTSAVMVSAFTIVTISTCFLLVQHLQIRPLLL